MSWMVSGELLVVITLSTDSILSVPNSDWMHAGSLTCLHIQLLSHILFLSLCVACWVVSSQHFSNVLILPSADSLCFLTICSFYFSVSVSDVEKLPLVLFIFRNILFLCFRFLFYVYEVFIKLISCCLGCHSRVSGSWLYWAASLCSFCCL